MARPLGLAFPGILAVLAGCGSPGPAADGPATAPPAPGRLNVLMIAVDDLRPAIGCYGDANAITPNLDRLAAEGIRFDRAYCQQAVCSPSRVSLLTGRRPDTTKVYNLVTPVRIALGPDAVTLPQHFRRNGYETVSLGKIYHPGIDDPPSWSRPPWNPSGPQYIKPESEEALQAFSRQKEAKRNAAPLSRRGPPWEDPDVADDALFDGKIADRAVAELRRLQGRPFFLAVGFHKPHLPFIAPRKYFDLHAPGKFHPAPNPFFPKDAPPIAGTTWGELRFYAGVPAEGPLPDAQAVELIRAYYAAASYTDAQVGKVLAELDRLGLRERTIVVLWGDHGWQLGEHGLWCKHTNFELAARAPLLLRTPGGKAGVATKALVEFVDVYPTLAELAALPPAEGLEGTSLVPLLADPGRPWKSAAFSQYPRERVMGHSLRMDRWRYTEWAEPGKPPVAEELYDHEKDPDENENVAGRPENAATMEDLRRRLREGWRAARPADAGGR